MVRPIDISNVLNSLQMLGQSNRYQAELERQKQAKKSQFLGSIGSVGGGIVGGIYGGPMGAAAGSAVGSAVGQKLGGGEPDGGQVIQAGAQGYQMGSAMEQRQNNQKFNTSLSDNISANKNATPQQKQFAESIKDSPQDYNTTARQAQYLGLDPKSLEQQSINRNNNTAIINRGSSLLKEEQSKFPEGSAQFKATQLKIDRIESLRERDLGKLGSDTITGEVRSEFPTTQRVYIDKGKVLMEERDPLTGQSKTTSLGNAQTDKENLYQVPYYDKNGNPKVRVFSNLEKAKISANKEGSGILNKGESIWLTNLKERYATQRKIIGESGQKLKTERVDFSKVSSDAEKNVAARIKDSDEVRSPSRHEIMIEKRRILQEKTKSGDIQNIDNVEKEIQSLSDNLKRENTEPVLGYIGSSLSQLIEVDPKSAKQQIAKIREDVKSNPDIDKDEILQRLSVADELADARLKRKRDSEKQSNFYFLMPGHFPLGS